jgi:hypothetical protein
MPVGAAAGARQEDRAELSVACGRRRFEDRTVHVLTEGLNRFLSQLRAEVDQIVDGDALAIERRRLGREWLGRRVPLAGDRALRDRSLLDRPDRLARRAIEHVREGLLRHDGDRLDRPAVHHEINEQRRRRRVVVPQPVMHELEVPDPLSRLGIEADQALGEEVAAGTMAAVVVVGGSAGGDVNVSELRIGGQHAPGIGAAGVRPRFLLPRRIAEFPLLRNRVELP